MASLRASWRDTKNGGQSRLEPLTADREWKQGAGCPIQYTTLQCNAMQCNTIQHNTTRHNTTQHNTTQHNTTQHNTTQHNTTQHNTTQHNTTQHNTTQTRGGGGQSNGSCCLWTALFVPAASRQSGPIRLTAPVGKPSSFKGRVCAEKRSSLSNYTRNCVTAQCSQRSYSFPVPPLHPSPIALRANQCKIGKQKTSKYHPQRTDSESVQT